LILEDVNEKTNPKYHALNRAVAGLVSVHERQRADKQIEDQNIVSFLPLDVQVEDSVNTILSHIDNMMQYGEDEEPKMPKDMDEGESYNVPLRFRAHMKATLTRMSNRQHCELMTYARVMLYNHMHPQRTSNNRQNKTTN